MKEENISRFMKDGKIKELYDDFATMRRYLVDYKFVIRDDYGKSYQLNPAVELENWR